MRNRIIRVFALALVLTVLFSNLKIGPVRAPVGGNLLIVGPGNYADLFSALTNSISNDEIHVLAGHIETWTQDLDISVPGLWIIGPPLCPGPTPIIDMAGHQIHISADHVFIWGLIIIHSTGIYLDPGSHDCMIWNNTIQSVFPATIGIRIYTGNNIIALNQLVNCSYGPGGITAAQTYTCPGDYTSIALYGDNSTGNIVKFNTLYPPYLAGIVVGSGAGFNYVCWNNIMSTDPTSLALWDNGPSGSPLNWFDAIVPIGVLPPDFKGNYEANYHSQPNAYPVQGPNAYFDNYPLAAPVSPILQDMDLNGVVGLTDLTPIFIHAFGLNWPITLIQPNQIPPQFEWDPRADVAFPPCGQVRLPDLVSLALHWGQHSP